MSTEQTKALRRVALTELIEAIEAVEAERDALRAELAAIRELEPVAYLHECRKKPELRELSFEKKVSRLANLGFAAEPI
jgi:hypothetical protein